MNKLSDKKIIKLIWGISTVICCLLIYFVCLPFYKGLIDSGGSITGVLPFILLIFTIFLLLIIPLISYVTALFLIDCLRLSQQTLIRNKVTAILIIMSVLILVISPMVSLKKLPNINELIQALIFYLVFPIMAILLSRFILQRIIKYPILLGLASMITFNILGFMYLSLAGIRGEEGYGMGLLILFESMAVCLISVIVNLKESKKIKTISGRTIK